MGNKKGKKIILIEKLTSRLSDYQPLTRLADERERDSAAVLIPVVDQSKPTVILTQRASHMGSHAGEVAWPGGRRDPEDESLKDTALRESFEEIGLPPESVTILSEMRPFISKHGLRVTPYVGLVDPSVVLKANPAEIDTIFQVPLSWLASDPRSQTDLVSRYGEDHEVPVYIYNGFRIWGLTAMILWEFMVEAMGVESTRAAYDKLTGKINEGW